MVDRDRAIFVYLLATKPMAKWSKASGQSSRGLWVENRAEIWFFFSFKFDKKIVTKNVDKGYLTNLSNQQIKPHSTRWHYPFTYLLPFFRCCSRLWRWCCGPKEYTSRTVWIGRENWEKFPPNIIRNQKYNVFTFIPIVSTVTYSYLPNSLAGPNKRVGRQ